MNKNISITSTQLILLFTGSALMFPYTFLPAINAPPRNQDVWIVAILAIVYSIIFSMPLLFLINKFRGQTANQITENIMGKFFGKIVCFIFSLFFIFCYTACLLMIILFVKTYLFPQTPNWALLLYSIAPISYCAYKGAGTIARLATFIVPYMILTIIAFFIMGTDQFQPEILRPVFTDSNILDINKGAFLTGARISEIFIFFVFSTFLEKKANINKAYFKSIGSHLLLLLLILLPTVLVLGLDVAKHSWNPYFLYVRLIRFYDFIQRIESLNTLAWLLGAYLKLAIYSYMASQVLSGIFNMKSHKKLVIPISILTFIMCMIPALLNANLIEILRSDNVFPWIVFPVVFVIPVFMIIVYIFKKLFKNLN